MFESLSSLKQTRHGVEGNRGSCPGRRIFLPQYGPSRTLVHLSRSVCTVGPVCIGVCLYNPAGSGLFQRLELTEVTGGPVDNGDIPL